jgi:taurine dioxygenase
MVSSELQIEPAAGHLGAEIRGVDLSTGCDEATLGAIRDALRDFLVVFVRDQKLDREAQLEFARRLGKPEVHPIANGMEGLPEVIRVLKPAGEEAFFGTSWHSDNSFFERPSAYTVLYGDEIPPYGGDTEYASMATAYDHLSQPMKDFLAPLSAIHSATTAYDPRTTGDAKYKGETAISYTYSDAIHDEVEHPVIRTHRESGRKCIYVNPMFTQRIVGLNPVESEALLAMLHRHATRPDFTCRFRWTPGTLAIWDNRAVQHYAIDDYRDYERVMYRVTIEGERPER